MSEFFIPFTTGALPPGVVETITGNDGTPEAAIANNFTIITANATPKFLGSPGTETLDFGLANLVLGSSLPALTSGTSNVGLGFHVLQAITAGASNTCIGIASGSLLTTGQQNVAVGAATLENTAASQFSVAIGTSVLSTLTSGDNNTGCGDTALSSLVSGHDNSAFGNDAGTSYTGAESSNLMLANSGTLGESNTIRIGTQGAGAGQQNRCFAAGITGVTVAASAPVGVKSDGQLSSLGFGSAGQVLTSNGGAASPTWQGIAVSSWQIISASQTLVVDDRYICVSPGGALALLLPAVSQLGDMLEITLDGATSFAITQGAGQSVRLGNVSTTVGVGGSITTTQQGDTIRLVCQTANLKWNVLSTLGNLTVV